MTNNPEKETRYQCMKHLTSVNEKDLHCRDPEIYCKFRTSCPIYFLSKEGNAEMLGDVSEDEKD